jgi:cell division protein FtsB
MQQKTKYIRAVLIDFIYRLRDIRFAGQVLFVVIVLLISWSGVKAILMNYGLEKQIAAAKQENELQQLENNDLKLQNEYYQSNQYLELQARLNFGLAQPGEQEILVPENVALSYAPKVKLPRNQIKISGEPAIVQNIQAWFNFFIRRT